MSRTRDPKRSAEREAELACPPFPDALSHVWSAFCRLSGRRTVGMAANPITWSDIDAFVRLSGVRLAPWEIRLIEELDDLYRAEHSKKRD